MTTETLSSDDDGPRRQLPRGLIAVAVVLMVAAAATGVVVQRHRADERRAVRLAALDDGNLRTRITGGGTGVGSVQLDVSIDNAGRHPVVVGSASTTVPGVAVTGSTLAGVRLNPGVSLTDELQLDVTCPKAADSSGGGQLLIAFTTAAHRPHMLRIALDPRRQAPDDDAMTIIRSQCGDIDAATAMSFTVLDLVPHARRLDMTVELANSGRSPLDVQAIRLSDQRLHVVVVPRLPVSIDPRRNIVVTLHVTVATCGPEPNGDGSELSVVSANEYGDSVDNISDRDLARAFRTLVSPRCPQG